MGQIIFSATGLLLAGLMGYLAQSIQMCMVRGVNEWRAGQPTLILAFLFSGAWLWVAFVIAEYADIELTMHRYMPNMLFALGGFIFGIGCAINRSCGLSTISELSRGNLHMLLTLVGWCLGWKAWLAVTDGNQAVPLPATPDIVIKLLIAISLLLTFWALSRVAESRKIWLRVLAFGLLGGFLLLIEYRWYPIIVVVDSGELISGQSLPDLSLLYRMALLAMLMLGMGVAAWHMQRFGWHRLRVTLVLRNLVAGIIMGVGASMALGGNLLQVLLPIPTASPAGFLTIVTMLLGLWLGLAVSDTVSSRGIKIQ